MARDWEALFNTWAQPPSTSEQERIENAVRAVRQAMDGDPFLKTNTKVYVQGSYRNRVNVRQDSDVDIGVLYTGNAFGVYYPEGVVDANVGNVDAGYSQRDFKDRVGQALVRHFGSDAVARGTKAFDVHANTYRIDADVVPTFVHRRYRAEGGYICGVQLFSDDGFRVVNWPERLYDDYHWPPQHYENAVTKNDATSRAFKGVVRILKALRNEMDEAGIQSAKPIFGFFVECLVWNADNYCFAHPTWDATVQAVLANLWGATKDDTKCADWGEVSELKYLLKGSPGKREQAHTFLDTAWDYVGVRA